MKQVRFNTLRNYGTVRWHEDGGERPHGARKSVQMPHAQRAVSGHQCHCKKGYRTSSVSDEEDRLARESISERTSEREQQELGSRGDHEDVAHRCGGPSEL